MKSRIGLTGDVMLGRIVDERQRTRPVDAVWGDMREPLRALDGLIINLECCLSTRGRPWTQTHRPFHFRADPGWAIEALDAIDVDACALANNHILDFEDDALADTLDALDGVDIARSGAGLTRDEAIKPAVITIDDLTVTMISLTDNAPEFAASEDTPGTAHIDIDVDNDETRATVDTALSRATAHDPDLLVASLHWGPNMTDTPPAGFRSFAHYLIDEGVDVVHGHSAHVFHGIEVYDACPILYDCGDFVDDYAVDLELRNDRSFLFNVAVDADGTPTALDLHPVEIADCSVNAASGHVATWCRHTMRRRSQSFGTTFERHDDGLRVLLR